MLDDWSRSEMSGEDWLMQTPCKFCGRHTGKGQTWKPFEPNWNDVNRLLFYIYTLAQTVDWSFTCQTNVQLSFDRVQVSCLEREHNVNPNKIWRCSWCALTTGCLTNHTVPGRINQFSSDVGGWAEGGGGGRSGKRRHDESMKCWSSFRFPPSNWRTKIVEWTLRWSLRIEWLKHFFHVPASPCYWIELIVNATGECTSIIRSIRWSPVSGAYCMDTRAQWWAISL